MRVEYGPGVKKEINRLLQRTTGYQLHRTPPVPPAAPAPPARVAARPRDTPAVADGQRALRKPAFVISSVRSGSTLLRVLLDSHSQIHAPHETHLKDIRVEVRSKYAERALKASQLEHTELQAQLWDRYLARELARTGKPQLVNKCPSDAFIVDEIQAAWPDARFVYLLRHPAAIARSRAKLRPMDSEERNWEMVERYVTAVERARQTHDGLTVRYEDLTADPERVTRGLCDFLGVPWEAGMLDYGARRRRFRRGLGDWSESIKSGEVQPAAPLPPAEEVPQALRPLTAAWGYPVPEPGPGHP